MTFYSFLCTPLPALQGLIVLDSAEEKTAEWESISNRKNDIIEFGSFGLVFSFCCG